MVTLTIDGRTAKVPEGGTILEAARAAGIAIPTLCYLKDVNEAGACRVCLVEVEGCDSLCASCNTVATEGMTVHTNSRAVRLARRDVVEMMLSRHDCHCPTCHRSGNCALQTLAADLNIFDLPYEHKAPENRWNRDFPLIREESKCIGCLRCVSLCDKVQSLNVWDLLGTGSRARVGVRGGGSIESSDCSLCGQCITHCPTGALHARDDTMQVFDAIEDGNTVTVAQIAPAVRTAWAEQLGLSGEKATEGRMVAAVKALGFDYVLDTEYSADLTIMEEGSEFLHRFTHKGDYAWPMFTSCCPGWVRFVKSQFPEFVGNLSTAKSPQQMFGAIIKTYFARRLGLEPEKIKVVSIMPCVAKKYEAGVEALRDAGCGQDVDVVLTTRELSRMLRVAHIDVADLPEAEFDKPLGEGTGAGAIFGTTGGVMEAALRSAHYLLTGQNPDPDAFRAVRIESGWKVLETEVCGAAVRVAVSSGLGNARQLLEAIRNGQVQADFVEIMACPGGCAGGGGQPIAFNEERAAQRGGVLRTLDENCALRFSHENPDIQKTYQEFLGEPLGETAHHLLHTDVTKW